MNNPLDNAKVVEQKVEIRTLGEGITEQLKRNRELLQSYKDIGPAGAFGHAMISADIEATEKALANGDTVALLSLYGKLKDNK